MLQRRHCLAAVVVVATALLGVVSAKRGDDDDDPPIDPETLRRGVCDGDTLCIGLGWLSVIAAVACAVICCRRTCRPTAAGLEEKVDLRAEEYREITALARSFPDNSDWLESAPPDRTVLHPFPRGTYEWTGFYRGAETNTVHGPAGDRVPFRCLLTFTERVRTSKTVCALKGSGSEAGAATFGHAHDHTSPFHIDGLWSAATGRVAFSKVHLTGNAKTNTQYDPTAVEKVKSTFLFRGQWDGVKLFGEWHVITVAANFHESGTFELTAPPPVLNQLRDAPTLQYSAAAAAASDAGPLGTPPALQRPYSLRHTQPTVAAPQLYPPPAGSSGGSSGGNAGAGGVHAIAIPSAQPHAQPSTAATPTDRTPLLTSPSGRAATSYN